MSMLFRTSIRQTPLQDGHFGLSQGVSVLRDSTVCQQWFVISIQKMNRMSTKLNWTIDIYLYLITYIRSFLSCNECPLARIDAQWRADNARRCAMARVGARWRALLARNIRQKARRWSTIFVLAQRWEKLGTMHEGGCFSMHQLCSYVANIWYGCTIACGVILMAIVFDGSITKAPWHHECIFLWARLKIRLIL